MKRRFSDITDKERVMIAYEYAIEVEIMGEKGVITEIAFNDFGDYPLDQMQSFVFRNNNGNDREISFGQPLIKLI